MKPPAVRSHSDYYISPLTKTLMPYIHLRWNEQEFQLHGIVATPQATGGLPPTPAAVAKAEVPDVEDSIDQ
jgi:hypothetical protein